MEKGKILSKHLNIWKLFKQQFIKDIKTKNPTHPHTSIA